MLDKVTITVSGTVFTFHDLHSVFGFNTWEAKSVEIGPEVEEGCDGPLPPKGIAPNAPNVVPNVYNISKMDLNDE